MSFFGMGFGEITLILIIALIFLGPNKIVDFSRTLGKWVRAIKRAGNNFTTAVTREIENTGIETPSPKTEEKPKPQQITVTHKGTEGRP